MSHFTTTVVIRSAATPKDAVNQAEKLLEPYSEELEVPHEEWYPSIAQAVKEACWWRGGPHAQEYDTKYPEPERYRELPGRDGGGTITMLNTSWVTWLKDRISDNNGTENSARTLPNPDNGEPMQFGYLSTYNPKSKWDWYSLGGRWQGFWPVKSDADSEMWSGGSPGAFGPAEKRFDADVVRKGDIDFEYRLRQITIEAEADFDKWEKLSEGLDATEFIAWEDYYKKVQAGTLTIEEARGEYGYQEIVQRMRNDREFVGIFSSPADYFWGQENARERYVSEKRAGAFSAFALLDEDGWHEKGSMGWWGVVSDKQDERAWAEAYQKVIDELPDDAWLLNFDLHI